MPNFQKCSGQMVLALIIVCGFFFILYTLMQHAVPPENRDLVNILLGLLGGTAFAGVVSYYFGSSIGSRNKENTIEQLSKPTPLPEAPTPQAAPTVTAAPNVTG